MRVARLSALLLLPALFIGALFAWSLGYMVLESFDGGAAGWTLSHYAEFFGRSDYVAKLSRTVEISLITTAAALVLGYPVALFLASVRRFQTFFLLLLVLPWLVSVVVRTYGWIVLLGNRGTINSILTGIGLLDAPAKLMFNTFGVVIGLTHVFLPFMVISILAVVSGIDRSLREASLIQGAGPFQTFLRITLPLSIPGVLSGCAIVFLLSMGAVVTPLILGGLRDTMLGTQIYQDVFSLFNFPKAAAMAVILTVAALVVVLPLQSLERYVLRHTRIGS